MSEELAREVVLAAIGMSGNRGAGWATRLRENILEVGKAVRDGSRQIELAERMLTAKTFPGTLDRIEDEPSSTRVVLHLTTKPSKWHPDGKETVRTERTDGAVGQAQRAKAATMVGAPVMVWLYLDKPGDVEYRVLLDLQQLGPTSTQPVQAAPAPPVATTTPTPAPAPPPVVTATEPPSQLPLSQRIDEYVAGVTTVAQLAEQAGIIPLADDEIEDECPRFIRHLPSAHRVKVARRAMQEHQILNIYDWMNMTTEQQVGIRSIIDEEVGEQW